MSSKLIRLNDYCLVEYIEGNISASPTTQNFYVISNTKTNTHQVVNDNMDSLTTNNVENYFALNYSANTFNRFDKDTTPSIYSYNTDFVKSAKISDSVIYDTVRFHFAAGFNFSNYASLILSVKARENNGNYCRLASLVLSAVTAYDIITLNPTPKYLAELRYDRYVDVNVASLKYLNNNYYALPDNQRSTSLSSRLTGGIGLVDNCAIEFSVDEATTSYNMVNGQTVYLMYNSSNHFEAAITQRNEFDSVGVYISEATDGDYIEFYATYNGGFIADFLGQLKQRDPNSDWSIIYSLIVYEQLGTSFTQTKKFMDYQSDSFDAPREYCPILKYSGVAVSFAIDCTATIVNNTTGEQIIKEGSMTSFNPKRYGKLKQPLPLDDSINVFKIYNKIVKGKAEAIDLYVEPEFKSSRTSEGSGEKVYVEQIVNQPYYVDSNIISVSDVNMVSQDIDVSKIIVFKQGELRVILKPFTNILKFIVYDSTNGYLEPKALMASDTYKLVFINGNNKINIDNNKDNALGNLGQGELSFTVAEDIATGIIKAGGDRQMYITVNGTVMYYGEWMKATEKTDYDTYITKLKTTNQVDVNNAKAIQDLQNAAADNTANTIPTNVYIPGYVDQASKGSEKSSAAGMKPKA